MANDRDRAFWERLVREVEGGASQVAVARRYGVSPSWLGRWCRLVRSGAASSALLPVRVVHDRVRRCELIIGAVRLSFDEGTDPGYVALLARALAS